MMETESDDTRLPAWWPIATLAIVTVVGLVLRLRMYGSAVFGDELSTIWIVRNHGFFETIKVVSTDAEITPPIYFSLAWLSMKLGSSPELVRLPAMLAGTATIPLVWLLGKRTLGNLAGLFAAGLVAVSPFMVFFSAYGRAYSLMTFFVVGSTLAMLAAVRSGGNRWWFVYGLLSLLTMCSHYTGVFILVGQLGWLLWARPEARKPALLTNLAAAIFFLPWAPSAIEDSNSPTTDIMEFLQPHGFSAKLDALKETLFSFPLHPTIFHSLRGTIIAVSIAVATALVVAFYRYLIGGGGDSRTGLRGNMVALVFVLALSAPVGEALLLIIGTDLLGSRNLASAWPGIALSMSAIFVAAGPAVGLATATLAIFGFAVDSSKLSGAGHGFAYREAAAFVDSEAEPGDIVIDAAVFTPVPLTGLDAQLPQTRREYRLEQPEGPPPFLPFTSPVPDPREQVNEAFRKAAKGGDRVFAVTNKLPVLPGSERRIFEDKNGAVIPKGWEVESIRTFVGIEPQTVTVFRRRE